MDNDEPQILLREDNGANPVEYVLHALAGCLTTTMVYHAAARGIQLEGVESSLEGDLDLHGFLGLKDVPRGYQKLRVQFLNSAATLPNSRKKRLWPQERNTRLCLI